MKLRNRFKKAFELTPSLIDLKRYSPVVFVVERLFCALQFLSPVTLFFLSRMEVENVTSTEEQIRDMAARRGRRVEYYVLLWALLLALCAVVAYYAKGGIVRSACIIIPLFRVFDIFQLTINMSLFDHMRIQRKHLVSGITRTLVLTLWNFVELIFCFGIVYCILIEYIQNATCPFDAYYFSAITQLTIGYGDLHPKDVVRILAPLQGIVGFIFVILIITRFVSLMPRIEAVQSGDRENSEKNAQQNNPADALKPPR